MKTQPAFIITILLWILALTTGAILSNSAPAKEKITSGAAVYILGPARGLLAEGLYRRADVYFHKGVTTKRDKAFDDFFQRWKRKIVPEEHAHSHGKEVEETLPWLRLASKSDPSNIEIYLVASYWLNGEVQRPDLAQQAILEAIEKNPDRYELHFEMARIQLGLDHYESALESINKALALIAQPNTLKDPEQAASDHPSMLLVQSYLNEELGNREDAIKAAEYSIQLRPSEAMEERLETLKSGHIDPAAAKERLHQLFHKEHQCARDEHDEHVHGPDCQH
ncbi:hypothetical protein P4E94_16800 [Pontiellaceae bacterium B12219]|nr:hypothetical protein [Pontiellaceae bacterium B12219]